MTQRQQDTISKWLPALVAIIGLVGQAVLVGVFVGKVNAHCDDPRLHHSMEDAYRAFVTKEEAAQRMERIETKLDRLESKLDRLTEAKTAFNP